LKRKEGEGKKEGKENEIKGEGRKKRKWTEREFSPPTFPMLSLLKVLMF